MYSDFLIRIGSYVFPMEYIAIGSYEIVPHQRQDEDPWRNGNGVLNREVLDNEPSVIKFTTVAGMTNAEVAAVFAKIHANYVNEKERKVLVTFYDPETDSYPEPVYMYIPNPHFPIDYIEKSIIYYNEISIELIGY